MHHIKLNRIVFSNILSYGNAKTEVIFDEKGGLTWVRGNNGAGKSTIIEALTFGLFGKPYRGINLPHLKNTANPKGKLEVVIDFDRIDNKNEDNYIITRSMTKSGSTSFFITKNGEIEKKGAGTTQKKIETEYLGFNKQIFENIISLNTIKTKPIIDMEPKDKRKLIESILTLSIDKFKEMNNKELNNAQVKFDSATSDVNKYSKDVNELSDIIKTMEQEREDDIESLEKELKVLTSELNVANEVSVNSSISLNEIIKKGQSKKTELDNLGDIDGEIKKLENLTLLVPQFKEAKKTYENAKIEEDKIKIEHQKLSDSINKIDIKSLKSQLDKINLDIRSYEDNLVRNKGNIDRYNDRMTELKTLANELKAGVPCNTCGKPSTDDDIEKIKNKYRDEYREVQSNRNKTLDKSKTFDKDIKTLKDKYDELKKEYDIAEAEYEKVELHLLGPVQERAFAVSSTENIMKDKEHEFIEMGYTNVIESVNKIENRLQELSKLKVTKDELSDEVNNLRSEMNGLKERSDADDRVKTGLQLRVDTLTSKINEKKEKSNDGSLASTNKKLDNAQTDLKTAHARVNKYSDQISVKNFIKGMYHDDGIKKIVLGIFVPNLNKAIAHNLKLFNIPYSAEFSDSMEFKFSSRFGMAEVYDGLSEGQKRKINFAIAMSFRDFVTSIADFKINLLFLDEVLDISTDIEALKDMIMLVKSKVKEIGNIYLISHRGDVFEEYFDAYIEATHDGRYSTLTQQRLTSTNTNY